MTAKSGSSSTENTIQAKKLFGAFSFSFFVHLASFSLMVTSLYAVSIFVFTYYCPSNPSILELILFLNFRVALPIILLTYGAYFMLYKNRFPFIEQFKSNSQPWPWLQDPVAWKAYLTDALKVAFGNQLGLTPFIIWFFLYFFPPETDQSKIPDFFTFLWHSAIMVFCQDFTFYWSHRFLHIPYFYSRVHKLHHKHINVINISSVYAHWFEYIIGDIATVLSGMIVLGSQLHIVTATACIFFRFFHTNDVHSGYNFPWTPFAFFSFSSDSDYHNFHHMKNIGNYGDIFMIWDTFFRTNVDYHEYVTSLSQPQIS